jgi:hypothetical protein
MVVFLRKGTTCSWSIWVFEFDREVLFGFAMRVWPLRFQEASVKKFQESAFQYMPSQNQSPNQISTISISSTMKTDLKTFYSVIFKQWMEQSCILLGHPKTARG